MSIPTTSVVSSWKTTNMGKRWSPKAVATLKRLLRKGFTNKQIAVLLRRTEKGVLEKINVL